MEYMDKHGLPWTNDDNLISSNDMAANWFPKLPPASELADMEGSGSIPFIRTTFIHAATNHPGFQWCRFTF